MTEAGDSRYIYQSELVEACFQHNVDHVDFKGLTMRTVPDEILCDKAFDITKNPDQDFNVDLLQ